MHQGDGCVHIDLELPGKALGTHALDGLDKGNARVVHKHIGGAQGCLRGAHPTGV
jgi:hypothetical protein